MKGWTVRTQATKNGSKGVASREVYLNNDKHQNHRNTERIHPIFGNEKTMSKISYYGESYAAKQAANGKGGRPPSSYAIEFTLNLPKGYRPDDTQWRKIVVHCLRQTAIVCGVEPKQIALTSSAILHQQKQDGSKQGTGDHCHIVIGKFTQDGEYLRNLQRKTVTAKMKESFNKAVKHYCGYDWTEYAKQLQEQKYPNKRPAPTWKVRAAKEREEIERQQAALDKQAAMLTDKAKDIETREAQLLTNADDIILTKRLMATFENQAAKWLEAHEKRNVKQLNRQANRLNKSLVALDMLGLLSGEPATLEAAEIMSSVKKYVDKITIKNPNAIKLPNGMRF